MQHDRLAFVDRLRFVAALASEVFAPRHLDWRLHFVGRRHPLGPGYVMRRWRNGEWQYRHETANEIRERLDNSVV